MPYPLFHPNRSGLIPMMLSLEEFRAEFGEEGDHVELKRGLSVNRLQEAVTAFSNAGGGVVVIGVDPSGDLVGVTQPGEKAKDIHQAVRGVANAGRYEVHQLAVGDVTLLVVSIARRAEGFAQAPSGVVLVRRGASNVALMGSELSRFVSRRSFEAFETTPTDVEVKAVDPSLLDRLADAYSWGDRADIRVLLEEENLATMAGGRQVLTVAGALLLIPEPAIIGGRPYIDIRRYSGDDPDPDKVWEVRGPIDYQVERATRDIVDELGSTSVIMGVQRVDMPKLPERVLREAIANAVAHRSYEYAGSAIKVEIRPSSVSITSPGALPEPVTVENIRFQQAARNDRVLGALRRLGLAEDLGKGIDRMEDDMAAELLQAPEFEDDGSFFTVRLKQTGHITPRERAWVRGLIQAGRIDGQAALVVVEVARRGSVNNGDVRALLGLDSVEARSILQDLVTNGVLDKEGQRGGTQYLIADHLGVPARIRHTDDEVDAIALELAAQGPVSNADLRQRTGLDRTEALAVFRRLVDRGALVQIGERRGTRYQLPQTD